MTADRNAKAPSAQWDEWADIDWGGVAGAAQGPSTARARGRAILAALTADCPQGHQWTEAYDENEVWADVR
jgi:hypothetical protein